MAAYCAWQRKVLLHSFWMKREEGVAEANLVLPSPSAWVHGRQTCRPLAELYPALVLSKGEGTEQDVL